MKQDEWLPEDNKKCLDCNKYYPITNFYRLKSSYGKEYWCSYCKKCHTVRATKSLEKIYFSKYGNRSLRKSKYGDRLRKIDKEYQRKKRADNKAKKYAETLTYNKKYPEKKIARYQVAKAIKRGEMKRCPCIECGLKAQAHHPDYSKPLQVIWLCPSHHKLEHERLKTISS